MKKRTDQERRSKVQIMKSIRREDRLLREKYPVLNHQNTIGMGITLVSALGMLGTIYLYGVNLIPGWSAILINAILASFLHEIEHDLIHNLYFRESKITQDFMFWIVWIFRGNTVSPWVRRNLHLNHHKESGTQVDVEERMIGNGMKMDWRRILTMIDQPMSFLINGHTMKKEAGKIFHSPTMVRGSFPVQFVFQTLWYNYIGWTFGLYLNSLLPGLGYSSIVFPEWLIGAKSGLDFIAIVWLIPNFIRQASLQFISSSMHYYGNVENVNQQTQVLHPWYLIPFQVFCFNFGSTHSIHHFVVNQPFYLRQMVAPKVHPIMKKYGVRFNDTQSNSRSNAFA
jgi:fatty acid desaturase